MILYFRYELKYYCRTAVVLYPFLSFHYHRYTSAKYTLLTFVPFNLLEQFRSLANAYFLLILIVCYILYLNGGTSVNPSSWILSVVFIFGVTMIKQGYEDFQRHRNDRYNEQIDIYFLYLYPYNINKKKDLNFGSK